MSEFDPEALAALHGPDTAQLLAATRGGDEVAREQLFRRLYEPLRRIARAQLARDFNASLDTTELVHETYLKLCGGLNPEAGDRAHFLSLSARAMRQILVDHFRSRQAIKRGGALPPLSLDEGRLPVEARGETLLALDQALGRLTSVSERAGRVVEMKFFGGMKEEEIAEVLAVSVRTVSSEWRRARAWLARELQPT